MNLSWTVEVCNPENTVCEIVPLSSLPASSGWPPLTTENALQLGGAITLLFVVAVVWRKISSQN